MLTDIVAGVCLYVLLTGLPAFYQERGIPIYDQITQGLVDYSNEGTVLIIGC